ncbi:MAG: HAD hydrolase-like protein [Dysgonomonas sp.]|nr:HAD hydrolase-like protein [Dysgonomonas sp.]
MTTVNYTLPLIDFNEIDTLIWDWNGTLLDDVEVNIKVVNKMLSRRGLHQLDLTTYKELFCFPVQSFHKRIGFDFEKESIEDISAEYHATYKIYEDEIRLNPDAIFILNLLLKKGMNQYILSAAMRSDLENMLNHFNIADKFNEIYGVDDICATGKIEIGKRLMSDNFLNPSRTLIIGDTLHDAEVADSLGVKCILFSEGHNSYDLMIKKGKVIGSLKDIVYF